MALPLSLKCFRGYLSLQALFGVHLFETTVLFLQLLHALHHESICKPPYKGFINNSYMLTTHRSLLFWGVIPKIRALVISQTTDSTFG